jgi:hypothetical protein
MRMRHVLAGVSVAAVGLVAGGCAASKPRASATTTTRVTVAPVPAPSPSTSVAAATTAPTTPPTNLPDPSGGYYGTVIEYRNGAWRIISNTTVSQSHAAAANAQPFYDPMGQAA